jgi:hypothetical protein
MMYPDAAGYGFTADFPAIAPAALPVRRIEQPILPADEGRARHDP